MKIKTLKELPGVQVGETFGLLKSHIPPEYQFHGYDIDVLIKGGWAEEVKEAKTLEEKLKSRLSESNLCHWIADPLAQIAEDHFKEEIDRIKRESTNRGFDSDYVKGEEVMKVFDEEVESYKSLDDIDRWDASDVVTSIRWELKTLCKEDK